MLRGVVERYVMVAVTTNEEGETYIHMDMYVCMSLCMYIYVFIYI